MTIRVLGHPLSGHCHRVELYLSLLGVAYETVTVELRARAHKEPSFLAKNPFGQVPVLEDGDVTLADSAAILVYLAERYDRDARFWPEGALARARVQRWLSVAAGQLAYGPAAARRAKLFGEKLDYEAAVRTSQQLLTVMEQELAERPFLIGERATLADLAMYAYTARAPEGDVSLEPFPAVRAWLGRVEALPGFVPMVASRS